MAKHILLFAAVLFLSGCSQPILDISEPSEEHQSDADHLLASAVVDPARNVPHSEMTATVNRVLWPVRFSSYEVCKSLSISDERCELVLLSSVTVYANEDDPNAFADPFDNIHVFGGLVSSAGNDTEIAAVLAHEFAHIMYGHVEKKTKNALIGMTIAGGFAAAAASLGGAYDQQATDNMLRVGYEVGSRAYSPEMEIEADRTAIYILKHAGYSPSAMRDVIVRMNRSNIRKRRTLFSRKVGFLQTHPSNNRRIAHILSAIDDVESGVPLVVADR